MTDNERVITSKLSRDLAARLNETAARIGRSKSWIVRSALNEWLAEEYRRHELTMEALKSVDEGRTFSQEEVEAWAEQRKRERREA